MSINNSIGENRERYIHFIINKIRSNRAFLTDEDLKVLEFLSIKGDYENKKAILINKNDSL